MAITAGSPHSSQVTYAAKTDEAVSRLLPWLDVHRADWATEWTRILAEVERRSRLMGIDFAVDSVRDDLAAGRL